MANAERIRIAGISLESVRGFAFRTWIRDGATIGGFQKLWNGMLVGLMLAMLVAVTPTAAADDPSATIDTLEAALMAKDLDGAVALFAEDATARRTPPLPNTPACTGARRRSAPSGRR